ncbi:MAG: hypothetical protein U1E36_08635 [Rickettsiales bacterium]
MVDPITFDLTRIQEWTRERQDEMPSGPYIATYEKQGRRLQYIAADHEKNGKPNPTLPLINEAISTNPNVIIIETTPYHVQPGDILGNNEAKYTAALAEIKNIPWIPGEALNAEILLTLKSQGYTEQDAAHFYMLRAMVDENQRTPTTDVHALFQKTAHTFPPEERPSETAFTRWFAEHDDSGKSILQMTNEDTAPTLSGDASYFNIISHHVSTAREEHLDRLIEKALSDYGDVTVVYGKGHHLKSKEVYDTALGQPNIVTATDNYMSLSEPRAPLAGQIKETTQRERGR